MCIHFIDFKASEISHDKDAEYNETCIEKANHKLKIVNIYSPSRCNMIYDIHESNAVMCISALHTTQQVFQKWYKNTTIQSMKLKHKGGV